MKEIGNVMQWLQFIITSVGLITILLKIGSKQGEQEEKNKKFEEQGEEIKEIKEDVTKIKEDVAYIKGKLL